MDIEKNKLLRFDAVQYHRCEICGHSFEARLDAHYIARDNGKSGIAAAISHDEEKLYDAFDCPACGCQWIAQERKRELLGDELPEEEEDDDAETETENE